MTFYDFFFLQVYGGKEFKECEYSMVYLPWFTLRLLQFFCTTSNINTGQKANNVLALFRK